MTGPLRQKTGLPTAFTGRSAKTIKNNESVLEPILGGHWMRGRLAMVSSAAERPGTDVGAGVVAQRHGSAGLQLAPVEEVARGAQAGAAASPAALASVPPRRRRNMTANPWQTGRCAGRKVAAAQARNKAGARRPRRFSGRRQPQARQPGPQRHRSPETNARSACPYARGSLGGNRVLAQFRWTRVGPE